MSWNEVGSEAVEKKKVAFCTFPTGLTNIRVLDSSPHTRWQHWMPNAKRSVTCLGNKTCPICAVIKAAKAEGVEPPYSSRKTHSMNVINRTTGLVEVIEQGNNFFEELRELHTEEGDIREYDVQVKRTGVKLGTKYRLKALKHTELTEEEIALVEENKTDLPDYMKEHTADQIQRLIDGEDPKEVFSSAPAKSGEEIELV